MPEPGSERELAAFAKDIQDMAAQGGFDPFALLGGGAKPFHSVFLAPLSPALKAAIERFLADGGGPLAGTVDAIAAQGVARDQAVTRARALFASAQGVLVVVQAGEGGLATLPQLFHGQLDAPWRAQVATACAAQLGSAEPVAGALAELADALGRGTSWPALVAGPGLGGHGAEALGAYWLELAHGLDETLESGLGAGGDQRLGDLGHWIAAAADVLAPAPDGEDLAALARCRQSALEWLPAAELLARALAAGFDEDAFCERLALWAEAAARAGAGAAGAAWLAGASAALEERLGASYEVARARFRLQAAAGASGEELIATASLMLARDRKSCRHDLTREPIWAVRTQSPGPLLETVAAAERIGRSPAFVSRRLEQGTIPSHREQEQLRIPERALAAWKSVMDRFGLLEG